MENKEAKNERMRFTCFLTKEVHAIIKMHASMHFQTMNEWILGAILERLALENKYMLEHR